MIMNLEFWQRVKEEFEDSRANYICVGSDTFYYYWRDADDKLEVQRLARDFLRERGLSPHEFMGIYLFSEVDVGWYNRRSFRIEFINWVIKQFPK